MKYPEAILLEYPSYIDHSLFRKLTHGSIKGIVESEISVTVDSQTLISQSPLRVGERFVLSGGLYNVRLHYQSEIDAYEAYCTQRLVEQIQRHKEELAKLAETKRQVSLRFWEKYNHLPFDFSLDIKEVLSGLRQDSGGDGQKRNTVLHIYLHSDFVHGKLKRKKGDFLCSQPKIVGDWSGSRGSRDNDIDCNGVRNVPTCKKCLQMLESFAKK